MVNQEEFKKKYTNVTYLDHPLIKHKITLLRDKNTSTNDFRAVVHELGTIVGYEMLKNIPTELVEIETPIEKTIQPKIKSKSICIVPILRAGLGMSEPILELLPGASCGHIGIYRNEETHQPVEYLCKLPNNIENKLVLLVDPMLATGGSAIDAVKTLIKHGAKNIIFGCLIAAPEGVEAFCQEFPNIPLFVASLDRELNDKKYICPGLGDCGDRIFGTIDESLIK